MIPYSFRERYRKTRVIDVIGKDADHAHKKHTIKIADHRHNKKKTSTTDGNEKIKIKRNCDTREKLELFLPSNNSQYA